MKKKPAVFDERTPYRAVEVNDYRYTVLDVHFRRGPRGLHIGGTVRFDFKATRKEIAVGLRMAERLLTKARAMNDVVWPASVLVRKRNIIDSKKEWPDNNLEIMTAEVHPYKVIYEARTPKELELWTCYTELSLPKEERLRRARARARSKR